MEEILYKGRQEDFKSNINSGSKLSNLILYKYCPVYVYMHIYVYIYIYVHIYMYVYTCIKKIQTYKML